MVLIINAVNLIDGLDGLASGVSALESFALLITSVVMGNTVCIIASAALCGALAREARAGALLLTHLNPLYNPASLLAEAREAYPAAELARLGERYRI